MACLKVFKITSSSDFWCPALCWPGIQFREIIPQAENFLIHSKLLNTCHSFFHFTIPIFIHQSMCILYTNRSSILQSTQRFHKVLRIDTTLIETILIHKNNKSAIINAVKTSMMISETNKNNQEVLSYGECHKRWIHCLISISSNSENGNHS